MDRYFAQLKVGIFMIFLIMTLSDKKKKKSQLEK